MTERGSSIQLIIVKLNVKYQKLFIMHANNFIRQITQKGAEQGLLNGHVFSIDERVCVCVCVELAETEASWKS